MCVKIEQADAIVCLGAPLRKELSAYKRDVLRCAPYEEFALVSE